MVCLHFGGWHTHWQQFAFFLFPLFFCFKVVCLHSGGGLLVTVIIKYADNIAKTIAVATSGYSVEELTALEPTAVFDDLSDCEAFFQVIDS